ncbi:MAG: hypothetical protein WAM14_25755 [Candidatus Nitrosopolaris sp.]
MANNPYTIISTFIFTSSITADEVNNWAWLLNMARAEKEEYVIEHYKQNRSIIQTSKLMHSFRDIGIIINKVKAETERGHSVE